MNQEFNPEERESHRRRSRRSSEHGSHRSEDDIKAFMEDETRMAREILHLKKEMNRLHYKVKHYGQQTRLTQWIIGAVNILLLLYLAYKANMA